MCVSCECCVLSGVGLCEGPITCPEESYTVWCVSLSVIRCNKKPSTPTLIRENRSTVATSPHHRLQAVGPSPLKYSSRPIGKTSQIHWGYRQEKTFPPALLGSTQPSSIPVSIRGASSCGAVVNVFPYRQMCACHNQRLNLTLFYRQQAVLVYCRCGQRCALTLTNSSGQSFGKLFPDSHELRFRWQLAVGRMFNGQTVGYPNLIYVEKDA